MLLSFAGVADTHTHTRGSGTCRPANLEHVFPCAAAAAAAGLLPMRSPTSSKRTRGMVMAREVASCRDHTLPLYRGLSSMCVPLL